jgi:hypothetical protein
LRYPQKLVAIASAELDGAAGWVVLDGPRSLWYPTNHFPPDERTSCVLKIHVGRQLLSLPLKTNNRPAHLQAKPQIPDTDFVAAYEQLLNACETNPTKRANSDNATSLRKHFERYVTAAATIREVRPAEALVTTYQRLLALAEETPSLPPEMPFDSFAPVGQNFRSYVGALLELNRGKEISPLIQKLLPLWNHNLGYGQLGNAAFKTGDRALAESLFVKLKNGLKDWHQSEEMASLAEIWIENSKRDQARQLLLDCLLAAKAEASEDPESDVREILLPRLRQDFLRLFPGDESALEQFK